ncbi:MAG: adenylate/guanylate cyclase domain-containing protein [Leptonema sp. (in: bacteria)]
MLKKKVIFSASEDRLERLISERLMQNSNKEEIDERIWNLFGEEWCIMFTDLSGFSRNVEKFGIIHFLQIIYESHRILIPVIEDFNGFLLKTEGDSFFVIFRNPIDALRCSIEMNQILEQYNRLMPDEEKILLCTGLGYGKVLKIGDTDMFGAEVNAASKLGEDTAKAKEILVTENFKNAVNAKFPEYRFDRIDFKPPGANAAYKVVY